MRKEVTQVTYEIRMTVDEFAERGLLEIGDDERGVEVHNSLRALPGVYEVDFNGHFGPVILITMAKKCDVEPTWNMIWEIIGGTDDGTC